MTSDAALVRVFASPYQRSPIEGVILCRDHLKQLAIAAIYGSRLEHEDLTVAGAAFWGQRCFMCGVEPAPNRLCENESCHRPLHAQWPAVYCCNDCALEDS